MARRSSGGGSYRPASRPAARSAPPQKASSAPPPAAGKANSGGSVLGNLGSAIADGFSFGAGNAFAHRMVEAVMGPRTIKYEAVEAPAPAATNMAAADACGMHTKAFQDCLNNSGSDIGKCQFYMDMLSECKRNSGSGLNA